MKTAVSTGMVAAPRPSRRAPSSGSAPTASTPGAIRPDLPHLGGRLAVREENPPRVDHGLHGGRFWLVVEDEPDEHVESLLEKEGLKLLPYHDFRREAARAFENFGTPHHYVLDASGNVVFAGEGSDEIGRIPRQIAALLRR